MPHQPPTEARIALLFEKFSSFVEDYASNLSMGGMFLRTEDLRPVGSIVDFEVKLSDGFQLVQGLGEVVWARPHDQGPDRPAGLAVRFQALDDKGRELILKIMEEQVKSGGEPFDLNAVPEGALSEPGGGASLEIEQNTADDWREPTGVVPLPLAPRPDPSDVEAKILGQDGFTLLDAESQENASPHRAGPEFQELEFDAPWGEQLPEIPLEVLEEDLENEVTLPEAEALPEPRPTVAAEESFVLAQEAAEEVERPAPAPAGEIDFEDIDFSVPAGEAEAPAPEPEPAAGAEAGFDVFEAEAEEASPFVEEPQEDPTVVGTRAVAEDEPAIVSSEPAPVPDTPAPAPDAWAAAAPPSVSPADAPAPPAEGAVLEEAYDDDLFSEDAASGAGQVLRQALAGSRAPIAAAALLAVLAAGYFFRADVAALLGLAAPSASSADQISASVAADLTPDAASADDPAAGAPPAESMPAGPPPAGPPPADPPPEEPSPEEPPTSGVDEPTPATAEVMPGAVETAESPPPVIVVSPGPTAPRTAAAEAADPEAGASLAAAAATRVERISWRRSEGGTLVTVKLDGRLADDRYAHSPLAYNPEREMVEIRGIDEPYVSGRIEVGSPEVLQIRIGHHIEPTGNEIHVVLDFPDAGPSVAEVRNLGDRLEILVRR